MLLYCKKHNRKMRLSEFEDIGFRLLCDECSLKENWERVRDGGLNVYAIYTV